MQQLVAECDEVVMLSQVAPMEQTGVAWHTCVQLAVLSTQKLLLQIALSAQSEFCVQPGAQRGWFGSVALQPEPSGQSALETQPARQLFEPSGFLWQIWPLVHSESCEQSCSRKQALARHWYPGAPSINPQSASLTQACTQRLLCGSQASPAGQVRLRAMHAFSVWSQAWFASPQSASAEQSLSESGTQALDWPHAPAG
jgi:hypothetical protein